MRARARASRAPGPGSRPERPLRARAAAAGADAGCAGRATPRPARAAEIIAFDNVIVVYKFIGDLHFYATADAEENEIILATVLNALTETVSLLLTCARAAARGVGAAAQSARAAPALR